MMTNSTRATETHFSRQAVSKKLDSNSRQKSW
jgi:hypothetical protein